MKTMQPNYELKPETAVQLDTEDPLRNFRKQFYFPSGKEGKNVLYFCGNSLGLQPIGARKYAEEIFHDWQSLAVEGHFRAPIPWMHYHDQVQEKMAAVVGAKPAEVVLMNTLTVNLHLMMVSFYRPEGKRKKILMESGAFPSDQYAVKSQLRFHGYDPAECLIELKPRTGETLLREEDILQTIEKEGDSIALILMGGINYYTGQVYDMKSITAAGLKKGCRVGFDLAHAAGNILLSLHDWNVDFAVWCNYKYLNAGPGSIAGCFVHERHANDISLPRFAGWWGHDKKTRFEMKPDFIPIHGAEGWQLSTAQSFQLAILRASLEVFEHAGMERIRKKSEKLTGYLEFLIKNLPGNKFEIITPSDPEKRGAQLSLRVKNQDKKIFNALLEKGVIGDWREPDVIRVAPAPLYNSYEDVFGLYNILKSI